MQNYSWQTISQSQEETIIYKYLQFCVECQPPPTVINRFNCLIFLGQGEKDNEVLAAWSKIFLSKLEQNIFDRILYRCYLIVVNHWLSKPQLQAEIPKLLALFERINPDTETYVRKRKILLRLLLKFQQSEQYLQLRRLANVVGVEPFKGLEKTTLIGDLIKRYPYLYQHCLLGSDLFHEQEKPIKMLQKQNQKQFEVRFSQYIIYRARLVQIARARQLSQGAGKIVRRVDNPTLISQRGVKQAVRQFLSKVDGKYTYWQLAHRFLVEHQFPTTYQTFKRNLYKYLIYSLEFEYAQRINFYEYLATKIEGILPQSNSQELNQFLWCRTCSQSIKLLMSENTQEYNPYSLMNLVTTFGVAETVGLLLKIVLICPDTRAELEKRAAVFYTNYEFNTYKEVPWLIKMLENIQIGLSIYFGKIDISVTKVI